VATEKRLLLLVGIVLPGAGKCRGLFAAPDAPAESPRQPAGAARQSDKVGRGLWDSTRPVTARPLCSTTGVRATPRPLWSQSGALIAHHHKLHRESGVKRLPPPVSGRAARGMRSFFETVIAAKRLNHHTFTSDCCVRLLAHRDLPGV
jgi:hypothetical protein